MFPRMGIFVLGGDPNGFDLIIGIKSLSGSAANTMYQGTYFNAALENDASRCCRRQQ